CDADSVERLDAPDACPDCGIQLEDWGERGRTVVDCEPVRAKVRLLRITAGRCPRCGKLFRPRARGVLPNSRYSNRLLAQAAVWHYVDGLTLGHISRQFQITSGALAGRMHALAEILRPPSIALVAAYRLASVKHADETGWRCDGRNGYTWGFFTPDTSVFRCRATRSGDVAMEVFGEVEQHSGTLVVDRYGGYNRFGGNIQYCYEHLRRDAEKVADENPENAECVAFVNIFSPLLSRAMKLRKEVTDETAFLAGAASLKSEIEGCAMKKARHPDIQHIQNIFRENPHRLYHWATNRAIPADNNRAERELRPLVIARKISFGSQSEKGLETREIMMTVLNTVAKRSDDVAGAFTRTLDALAENPNLDVAEFLFGAGGIAPPSG
ncbi:MAG: IS66 family transposase, partial [bacterium]